MAKEIIQPAGLPSPGATRSYSHGVRSGNLLFLAGQTGTDVPAEPGAGRFGAQVRRAFARMEMILQAAGGLSFDSFRLAWTLQYAVWALAVLGILITRRKARRLLALQDDRILLEGING